MRYLFLIIYLSASFYTYGQEVEVDTLPSSKDSIVVGNDEKLQNDIIEFSKKDNLLSRLVKNIIKEDSKNGINGSDFSYFDYEQFTGKIIKEITVVNLDVFGKGEEKDQSDLNFITKAGNAIHITTRPWIIRNQLLFKKGDRISPFVMAESERLLREKSYIYSAEIQVVKEAGNSDSVSVTVKVRDVWSILPDGSFDFGNNRWFLKFEDSNFLGYGMKFFGAIKRRYTYGREWSIDGGIQWENLLQRHITAKVFRDTHHWGSAYGLSLSRDFVSPVFNWAGGADISWMDNHIFQISNDTFNLVNEKLHRQEYWLGYATDFARFTKKDLIQNEYYIAASLKKMHYFEAPEIIHDYYGDSHLALVSLGYSFRRYHKTRYVRYLGRMEDIPSGAIVSITAGKRIADQHRNYFGLKMGYSFFKRSSGYISAFMEAGSYYSKGRTELGSINANINYFTPLIRSGRVSMRNFISFKGAYLHNPFLFDHLINLLNNEDIRGFPAVQTGNKKFTLNYEINLYPPVRILGFNFSLIGFADLSWLTPSHHVPGKGGFYQGFGGGFRIKNEMLVFRSVQVLFGYYPTGTDNKSRFFEQPRRFFDMEFIDFMKPQAVIE